MAREYESERDRDPALDSSTRDKTQLTFGFDCFFGGPLVEWAIAVRGRTVKGRVLVSVQMSVSVPDASARSPPLIWPATHAPLAFEPPPYPLPFPTRTSSFLEFRHHPIPSAQAQHPECPIHHHVFSLPSQATSSATIAWCCPVWLPPPTSHPHQG